MKYLKTVVIAAACSIALLTSALYPQTGGNSAGDVSGEIVISNAPTTDELTKEFTFATEGKHELFAVLSKIASKKDNAVPALDAYLFTQIKSAKEQDADTASVKEPSRLFAVFALEAISTPAAYAVLMK